MNYGMEVIIRFANRKGLFQLAYGSHAVMPDGFKIQESVVTTVAYPPPLEKNSG